MGLSEAFGGHHQPDCGVNEFVAADAEVRVVRENETPCACQAVSAGTPGS